jgi:hypothetical protein
MSAWRGESRGEAGWIPQLFCGLALGAVAFLLMMPGRAFFAGADGFRTHEDPLNYTTTLRYYVWDAWRWPPLRATGLGSAEGIDVVFTDSIPLYAFGLKLARRWLSPDFNFLGVWLAICYAAQGIAAALALRAWRVRRWLPVVAGVALAVSAPSWIARYMHLALCFHAPFLLAAAWPALRWRPERVVAASAAVGCVVVAINPYLFLMYGVLHVALLAVWISRGWSRSRAVVSLALFGGVVAAEMAFIGYFGAHGRGEGFTMFSMNVLSPVYPPAWSLLGRWGGELDATGGQSEGFQYLGLGMLLACGATLAAGRAGWNESKSRFERYRPYGVAALWLAAFSLSTVVHLGDRMVLLLPTPPQLIAQFRAPGRFFWPVAYLAWLFVVVALARRGRRGERWLLAAVALQWLDVAGLRAQVREVFLHQPAPFVERAALDPLLDTHSQVVVAPSWQCSPPEERYAVTEVMYRASGARSGLTGVPPPVSTVYASRPIELDCARDAETLSALLARDPGALAIVFESARGVATPAEAGWRCARFAAGRICSARAEAAAALRAVGAEDPEAP